MIKNQEWSSDMMIASPEYWARVADYILLYDQIVIPTGNLQILPVLRLMLGEAVFDELIRTNAIVLARFDQWFGYVGTGGVIFYRAEDNPTLPKSFPNLAISHFKRLDEAIDDALIATNPPSTNDRRASIKNLLLDNITVLPTEAMLSGVKEEAYADIRDSAYLREFLSLRNAGRSIDNLFGSKPDTVTIFNPHVPAERNDPPEIRAVLRVVFENFLLSLGGHTAVSEITGDASTLSVIQAKGQRIGYSPHGRQAFAQLQKVNGVPELGAAFAAKRISPSQILDLRTSKHTQALRDWLGTGGANATASETVARYIETIGNPGLIEKLPVKAMRFAATNAWGSIEPITGTVAAAVDTFLLSKWFPVRSPRLFMRQAKVVLANNPVIRAPVIKGRDRNSLCSCGSGKKYKYCCGRVS
ncbi:MAG: SEC-C domain-containing protein [Nitrosomonas sp.]|nr:SEC-C domain-containing protein [Nitrosomonas sp.]